MLATDLKQLRRVATCGLLACALIAPAASARPVDEPLAGGAGARTSSLAGTVSSSRQDLRSPDTRDAAARTSSLAGTVSSSRQDLRSPDTRDAAAGYVPAAVSQDPVRTPDVATPGGFDWTTAGLTAGILVGLLAVMYGTAVAVRHGRRHIPGA